jgi:hypothetical protein
MCPCCSAPMLRHARRDGLYWFCPHCWQEMPDLDQLYAVGQALDPGYGLVPDRLPGIPHLRTPIGQRQTLPGRESIPR